METEQIYTVGEFADLIHKSVSTLQRWDRNGILKAYRTPETNRRFYTRKQYEDYLRRSKQEGKT